MDYLPDDLLFTIFVYSDIREIVGIPEFKVKLANNWKLLFTLYFKYVDVNQVEMINYSTSNFDYYLIIFCKLKRIYDKMMNKYLESFDLKIYDDGKINPSNLNETKDYITKYYIFNNSVNLSVHMFNIMVINNVQLFLDILEKDPTTYKFFVRVTSDPNFEKYSIKAIMYVKIIEGKILIQLGFYYPTENLEVSSNEIRIPLKQGLEILMYGINSNAYVR